ncbi:MAG: mechanosensitive ion channel family protein [Candidatus Falkowbacteria bacterium]
MFDQYFAGASWHFVVLGNSLKTYFLALVVFCIFLTATSLLHRLIIGRLNKIFAKNKNKLVDFSASLARRFGPPYYIWFSLYMALKTLAVHPQVVRFINLTMLIWVVTIAIAIGEKIITRLMSRHFEKDNQAKSFLYIISLLIKVVFWLFGGIMILSNLGINVTSLVTGLGIGGIAIALALQNILGDLFSSFAIYLDKPFKVGDFIVLGNDSGFVQKIGIKTSRLLGGSGQIIIISNKELTSARIQNFQKLTERQAKIQLHVNLDTDEAACRQALVIARQAVEALPALKFDHTNIIAATDRSLLLEVAYAVRGADMQLFLDNQQELLLKITAGFAQAGIKLAPPLIATVSK